MTVEKDARKATILVVDDSATDRTVVSGLVQRAGWHSICAENGQQALDKMAEEPPDAVLTDLQMPGVDGLELVKQVRRDHPGVPVILMTAFGSEAVAAKALRAGATSYVPKQDLQQDLAAALRQVFATVRDRRRRSRLGELLQHQESCFVVAYQEDAPSTLVNHYQETLAEFCFGDETELMRIGMAISEAITNAVDHGNLELQTDWKDTEGEYERMRRERIAVEPYAHRKVTITQRVTPQRATFVVKDDGPGFNPSELPDPTDPENLLKTGGRGILLMRTFMDHVSFSDKGNELTMIKERSKKSDAVAK